MPMGRYGLGVLLRRLRCDLHGGRVQPAVLTTGPELNKTGSPRSVVFIPQQATHTMAICCVAVSDPACRDCRGVRHKPVSSAVAVRNASMPVIVPSVVLAQKVAAVIIAVRGTHDGVDVIAGWRIVFVDDA